MAINPVSSSATASLPLKQADQNVKNKVKHPAVAPQNRVVNAAPVKLQESTSTIKQTINKFA